MKKETVKLLLFCTLLLVLTPLSAQEPIESKQGVANRLYSRSLQMGALTELSPRVNHLWMAYQVDSTQPAVLTDLGRLLAMADVERGLDMMEAGFRLSGYDYQTGVRLLEFAAKANDLARAHRITTKLFEQRPNDKALRRFLMSIYEDSGQPEKALELVRQISGDDRDARVVFKEAQLLLKLERKDEAEQLLQQHLIDNPSDPMAAMMLISLYGDAGNTTKALELLKQAQEKSPDNAQLSEFNVSINAANGHNEALKEEILRVAQLEGSDPNRIQSLLTLSRSKTNDLTKLLPTLIETELQLHEWYSEEDRFALAAANDYLLLSDSVSAEAILNKLVANETRLPSAYYYFVEKHAQKEEVDQLDEIVTKGLKVLPEDGLLNLYSALVAINREDSVGFAAKVRHAIEVVDEEDAMYGQLALMQAEISMEQDKDWEEAVKYFEIAVADGIPTAFNNYAYALTTHGTPEDLNRAEEMARKAVQYDSENGSFLDTYAWILYLKKAYPLAKIYMERAISKEEEPDHVYYEHYADILTALGEYESALQALRKALEGGAEVSVIEKKILEITELQKQQQQVGGDEK